MVLHDFSLNARLSLGGQYLVTIVRRSYVRGVLQNVELVANRYCHRADVERLTLEMLSELMALELAEVERRDQATRPISAGARRPPGGPTGGSCSPTT